VLPELTDSHVEVTSPPGAAGGVLVWLARRGAKVVYARGKIAGDTCFDADRTITI
jgi:hypothetical protein